MHAQERDPVFLGWEKVEQGMGSRWKGPQDGGATGHLAHKVPERLFSCSAQVAPGLAQVAYFPFLLSCPGDKERGIQSERRRQLPSPHLCSGHPRAQKLCQGSPLSPGLQTQAPQLPLCCFSCEDRERGMEPWALGTVVTQDSSSFPLQLVSGSCIYSFHKY